MPKFSVADDDFSRIIKRRISRKVINNSKLLDFSSQLLGLGSIGRKSEAIDALSAVFDLQGFTGFCGQIEPQYSVPKFLDSFLKWLVDELKQQAIRKQYPEGAELWHPLPFFLKFLGDGLLVIWNTTDFSPITLRNLIISLSNICEDYVDQFLPTVNRQLAQPPPILRCGIARGTVFSVGDGNDYVGSCINMAARIQKLPGITFGFNRRGFDSENAKNGSFFTNDIVIRKVDIRGISNCELIGIKKSELEKMPKDIAAIYKLP